VLLHIVLTLALTVVTVTVQCDVVLRSVHALPASHTSTVRLLAPGRPARVMNAVRSTAFVAKVNATATASPRG
jgi:hypothetical protein